MPEGQRGYRSDWDAVRPYTDCRWRQAYNQVRPHSALGYRLPAPEAIEPQPMYA